MNVIKTNPHTHISFSDALTLLFDKTSISPKIRITSAQIAAGAIIKSANM